MHKRLKTNTDTSLLKLLGIITMTIDHAGKMLFPDMIILRIIGRIAFPIFAYCIVVGSLYTRDIIRYLLRLTACAVLFQVGYTIFLLPDWVDTFQQLNIFFTLAIGLVCIIFIQRRQWWLLPICFAAAYYGNIDYGIGGILLIITFYLFRNQPVVSALLVLPQLLFMITGRHIPDSLNIQSYAAMSIPFIYIKINSKIKLNKYVFYLFYPLHFVILHLLSKLLAI